MLLETIGLTVAYGRDSEPALHDASLSVDGGSCVGIVGESGSGKTTFGHALLGILGAAAHVRGRLFWRGAEMPIGSRDHLALRGREISYVPQDALAALNPSITVQEHFVDSLRDVRAMPRREAQREALSWLEQVQIRDPARVLLAYPHQLSGGQRQRVLIALALCTAPKLVVLDECTTALDVTIQTQILRLLAELRRRLHLSMIVISHDLGVVEALADEIVVLYASQIVERHSKAVFATGRAYHPYTKGLLKSTPRLEAPLRRLPYIAGRLPDGHRANGSCVFLPRCPFAAPECAAPQELRPFQGGAVRCVRVPEIWSAEWPAPDQPSVATRGGAGAGLVEIRSLRKTFHGLDGRSVRAVDGVDLSIESGETVGLVGESGSGKTTLARCVIGVLTPTSGEIAFEGSVVADAGGLHAFPHHRIQIVFQDPRSALNPRLTVLEQVARPIRLYGLASKGEALRRAAEMLEHVRLAKRLGSRYPRELSGGEAQRANIARALAPRPSLVILDEPVTALDVSVQAEVLNLLADLRDALGVTYLLIGHDLAVVRHMADRVLVMQEGRVVEQGGADAVLSHPTHPYTRELVDAARYRLGADAGVQGGRPNGRGGQ